MGKPFVEVNWLEGFERDGPADFHSRQTQRPDRSNRDKRTGCPRPSVQGLVCSTSCAGAPDGGAWQRCGCGASLDPLTDRPHVGEFKRTDAWSFPLLTTASDLVFSRVRATYPSSGQAAARRKWIFLSALDARTGQLLGRTSLAGSVFGGGPISYSAGGGSYIAVTAGNNLFAFALRQ